MNVQITENKLIELYLEIDDLFIEFMNYQKQREPIPKDYRQELLN